MTVIDADVFVRSLRYPRDRQGAQNEAFIARVKAVGGGFAATIFCKMEVLGIMSFGMTPQQLHELNRDFEAKFSVQILYPRQGKRLMSLSTLLRLAVEAMERKLSFGDALALLTAESCPDVDTFVTWNARHFQGKTRLLVLTPAEFLRVREGEA